MAITKLLKFGHTHNYGFQFLIKKSQQKLQVHMFSCSARIHKSIAEPSNELKNSSETEKNESQLTLTSSNEIVMREMSKSLTKSKEISYVVEEKDKEVVGKLKEGDILYPFNNPFERTSHIFMQDIKNSLGHFAQSLSGHDLGFREIEYFPRYTDILVIGNGPLGLAIAYEIRNTYPFGPAVILLDRNYIIPHESTNLGQAVIHQQCFTEEEEIQMTQYCVEFMSGFKRHTEVQGKPEFSVSYEPMGSLHLADEENAEKLLLRSEIMKKNKVHHKILKNNVLKSKFPWLSSNDIVFGSLGLCGEGLVDPWSFINGLKCKASNLGVTFVTAEAIDYGTDDGEPFRIICRLPDGTYNSISFAFLVLATGMETLNLTKVYNDADLSPFKLKLPLVEKKKYEYCFYNPDGPGMNTPIVVDTDGTYFRREGLNGYYIVGVPSVDSYDHEETGVYSVFKNKVVPFLKKRIPDCENYKLCKGWINSYDTNTANEIGITGSHPGEPKIIFANGFQNLGLQYVPAVARGVVERMFHGHYKTIDLSKFHIDNLYRKQHLEADRKRREMLETQERVALTE